MLIVISTIIITYTASSVATANVISAYSSLKHIASYFVLIGFATMELALPPIVAIVVRSRRLQPVHSN